VVHATHRLLGKARICVFANAQLHHEMQHQPRMNQALLFRGDSGRIPASVSPADACALTAIHGVESRPPSQRLLKAAARMLLPWDLPLAAGTRVYCNHL